mgnify:CR=1 FL=1
MLLINCLIFKFKCIKSDVNAKNILESTQEVDFLANNHQLEVKCNVNNCTYWQQGNICTADQIQVSTTDCGEDMEMGSFEEPATSASSHQTQCVSFRPNKNKSK